MRSPEDLDLRNRADCGQERRAFGAGARKCFETACADIVEIAPLKVIAIVVIRAPENDGELAAMPFGVENGARLNMDDESRGRGSGQFRQAERLQAARHILPWDGFPPEPCGACKRARHDDFIARIKDIARSGYALLLCNLAGETSIVRLKKAQSSGALMLSSNRPPMSSNILKCRRQSLQN